MAYSDLRRNALLEVEAGSEKQRALSQISAGLLKAFLFRVQTVKASFKELQIERLEQKTTIYKQFALINTIETLLKNNDFIQYNIGRDLLLVRRITLSLLLIMAIKRKDVPYWYKQSIIWQCFGLFIWVVAMGSGQFSALNQYSGI